MILNNFDIKILHAKDGIEVFSKYKENKICLILTDIKMPISDRIETTLKIQQQDKNIPIIVLAAYTMKSY